MLRIRREQVDAFERERERALVARSLEYLRYRAGAAVAAVDDADLARRGLAACARARRVYGAASEAAQLEFAALSLRYGESFDRAPPVQEHLLSRAGAVDAAILDLGGCCAAAFGTMED